MNPEEEKVMKKDVPLLFSLGRNHVVNDVLCVYSFIRRNTSTKQFNISNIYNKVFIQMLYYCVNNDVEMFSGHDPETIRSKISDIRNFYLNSGDFIIDSYTNRAPKWHNALDIDKHIFRRICQERYGVRFESVESYIPFMITKIWCPDRDDVKSFQEFIQETSNWNGVKNLVEYHENNLKSNDPVISNNSYKLLLMKICENYYYYQMKKSFNDFSSAKFLNQMIGPDPDSSFVKVIGKIVYNNFLYQSVSGNNGDLFCDYCFGYVVADCANEWRLYSFNRKYTIFNNTSDHPGKKWRNQIFPDLLNELYLGRKVIINGEIKNEKNTSHLSFVDMWVLDLEISSLYLL